MVEAQDSIDNQQADGQVNAGQGMSEMAMGMPNQKVNENGSIPLQ